MSLSSLSKIPTQQSLLPNMMNFKGIWSPSAYYEKNDVVQGTDNNAYVAQVGNANQDPVGGSLPSPWLALSSSGASGGMNFLADWNASATYGAEDMVRGTNGAIYIATQTNSNVNPIGDVNGGAVGVGANWTRLSGANQPVLWNNTDYYGVGDLVYANLPNGQTAVWTCGVPNSNTPPATGGLAWLPLADAPGTSMSYLGGWGLSNVYDTQDVVSFGGFCYVSTQNTNQGNSPASSPSYWTPFAGSNSITQTRYKSASPSSNAFCLQGLTPSGVAPFGYVNILTLPVGTGAGVNGSFSIAGSFGTGGSNTNTDNGFQVSDVPAGAPSSNCRFSEIGRFQNQVSGTTPVSVDLNYSFSNVPASNLYLNYINGSTNTLYNYALPFPSYQTSYDYANVITPSTFVADP